MSDKPTKTYLPKAFCYGKTDLNDPPFHEGDMVSLDPRDLYSNRVDSFIRVYPQRVDSIKPIPCDAHPKWEVTLLLRWCSIKFMRFIVPDHRKLTKLTRVKVSGLDSGEGYFNPKTGNVCCRLKVGTLNMNLTTIYADWLSTNVCTFGKHVITFNEDFDAQAAVSIIANDKQL